MSDNKQPDPMDFLKTMWGPMGFSIPGMAPGMPSAMPGMMLPTMDVEALQKRIADLKSVENWLTLNINVVKASVQGLEMQIATISAFKNATSAAQDAAQKMTDGFAAATAQQKAPAAHAATKTKETLTPWPWEATMKSMTDAMMPKAPTAPAAGSTPKPAKTLPCNF